MKRWLALLLVVIMVFSTAACSGKSGTGTGDPGKDVEDPGKDVDPGNEPGKTGAAIDGEFYVYEDMFDVFKFFKEIKFSYTNEPAEGDTSAYSFAYVYTGEEEVSYTLEDVDHVDNTKRYRITILEDGEETILDVWFNEAGDLVKAGTEGDYWSGDFASLALLTFAFHLMPFYMYNDGFGEVFTKEGGLESSGWHIHEHNSTTKNFGSGNVKVESYRFSWIWLAADLIYDWEVAEVGGKYLFTRWKTKIGEGISEMIVEKLIPF